MEIDDQLNDHDSELDELEVLESLLGQLVLILALLEDADDEDDFLAYCDDDDEFKRKRRKPCLYSSQLERICGNCIREASFEKLCQLVDPLIAKHYSSGIRDVEPMPTPLILHCLLRWLAGGSYLDIFERTGVCISSFYRVVDVGMKALLACTELDFRFPQTQEEVANAARSFTEVSQNRAITGCVACLDGFHLPIKRPASNEVANVIAFYSGHYRSYGINVQAACDHQSKFIFLDTAAPGSTNDVLAIEKTDLAGLINNLPDGYFALGDAAYCCTEKLLIPFTGPQRNEPLKSDYNFYHSQLRMKIECAFGIMTQRWRILQEPLWVPVNKVWMVLMSIGRLHNFCINQRDDAIVHLGERNEPAPEPRPVGRPPVSTSIVRTIVLESIANRGLARTGANINRNRNAAAN